MPNAIKSSFGAKSARSAKDAELLTTELSFVVPACVAENVYCCGDDGGHR